MGRVLVVGAGISGLSSALLLADAGHQVTIWARELTADTVSSVAGAYWLPYLCNPRDKAVRWARETYEYFGAHTMGADSGVRPITFLECFAESAADPWWKPAVKEFRRLTAAELPPGYADGYRGRSVLADTSRYPQWLLRQLEAGGVPVVQRTVRSLDEALQKFPVVVNCSGLGARELCGDRRVYPVRGQLLVVAKPAGITEAIADPAGDNFCYIVPRFDDMVIGGIEQPHNWNLAPNPADTAEILRKARSVLGDAEITVTGVLAGLRPARDEIRLEAEQRPGGLIVHNYGHGGAGYTLSWGCARSVASLVHDYGGGPRPASGVAR